MRVKVADEIKVRRKAGAMQHVPGVAAYGKDFASLDVVVFVQGKAASMLGNAAFVGDGLTEIFAGSLQLGQLEKPVSG